MTYAILYFPEAAYDRSGIELFEREVIPAPALTGRDRAVPRPADVVEAFLHHLAVERGSAANTLRSYTGDLHRYLAHLHAAGVDDLAAVREETSPVSSSRCAPTAAGPARRVVGRPGARGRPRAAPLRRPRRAGRRRRGPRRRPARAAPAAAAGADASTRWSSCSPAARATARPRCATGPCWSCSTPPARGSPRPSGWTSTTSTRAPARSCCAARAASSGWCRSGGPRSRRVEAYRVRARPALAGRGRGHARRCSSTPAAARLSRQSAWHVLRAAAEGAGVTREVSPHTLRHCFATHLLDGGADVRVVQELLGHASVTTTQIYTQVTVDTLREVYATSHPRALG